MNNIIKIGIPSKGRLKKNVLKTFKDNKLNLFSERGERDLFGSIKNIPNVKIIYLHAREIIQRLGDGSIDIGFTGFDLLKENEVNIQFELGVITITIDEDKSINMKGQVSEVKKINIKI